MFIPLIKAIIRSIMVYFNVGYTYHRLLDCIKKRTNDVAKSLRQKLDTALLHASVKCNNSANVQYLIDRGYDVNAQNSFGTTPLMLAIRKMNVMTTDILLKNNADIFICDSSGSNSLKIAAEQLCQYPTHHLRQQDVYVVLKKLVEKLDSEFLTNKTKTMQFLSNASDLAKIIVVAAGNVELAEFMLKNGYPVDLYDSTMTHTALGCAIIFGQIENIKLLINYGANVDDVGVNRSALLYYISGCQEVDENANVLISLLKHSTSWQSPNISKNIDLIESLLTHGTQKTVRAVLESGIDVTSANFRDGKSLIHVLVDNRNADVLRVLDELDVQFDVNARNYHDRSALVRASRLRRVESVEFLLEHGADAQFVFGDTGKSLVSRLSRWQRASSTKIIDPSFRAIVAHLAMLGTRNDTLLTARTRNDIESYALFRAHFALCTKQLEELKIVEVLGRVTLFKLLTESEDKVAGYTRNREFIEAFDGTMERMSCLELYYVNTLQRRVAKAMDKIELERKAALTIETLCGLCNDVYHVIVYKIISYLRRRDLENLCKVDLVVE